MSLVVTAICIGAAAHAAKCLKDIGLGGVARSVAAGIKNTSHEIKVEADRIRTERERQRTAAAQAGVLKGFFDSAEPDQVEMLKQLLAKQGIQIAGQDASSTVKPTST